MGPLGSFLNQNFQTGPTCDHQNDNFHDKHSFHSVVYLAAPVASATSVATGGECGGVIGADSPNERGDLAVVGHAVAGRATLGSTKPVGIAVDEHGAPLRVDNDPPAAQRLNAEAGGLVPSYGRLGDIGVVCSRPGANGEEALAGAAQPPLRSSDIA